MLEIETLKIAGINGIIGRADKVNTVEETEYLDNLKYLISDFPILDKT